MPTGVMSASTVVAPTRTLVASEYRFGFVSAQSFGLLTGRSELKVAEVPAATDFAAVVAGASVVPSGAVSTPWTLTFAAVPPELTTVVCAWTLLAFGVVTYV